MSNETLTGLLKPILQQLAQQNLAATENVKSALDRAFHKNSALVGEIRAMFDRGITEGWLCDKKAGTASFSRVAKPSDETLGFSIDAVSLEGPGVWHRHTTGEVDLCFAAKGDPRFDGHPEGWVIFAPGSDHVPTATQGTMNILYFIPQGALQWKKEG